jgi:hypothetical protein
MKLFRATIFIGICAVLFCFPDPAYGQSEPKSKFKADSTWSEWNPRISPYVWLVGLKGQLTLAPEPAQLPWVPPPIEQLPNTRSIWDIDLSFKEVRHSLKFAVMLAGQYKFERIITQFNLSSLVMESNAIAPFDYIFKDNTLSFTYVGGDLGAGYRLIRNKKVEFDLLLGLKFIYFKAGLRTDIAGELPISVSLDRLWTEPVVGTNLTYRPHKRIELMALGDIGSTLLNPNLTYQFALNGNFLISKHIFVSAGYRNYYIKFPKQEAIFTGTMHGMLVKFGLQF